jgi:outer membrane protein TolC
MRFGASGMLAAGLLGFVPALAETADGPLGATVDGLIAAGRQLSPALRAAALDTAAAAAKAEGADKLDDPTIADSYQYYKNPSVFSGHALTVSQAFPLWGKRDLRREAALADVEAARGGERAAQDALDEKIKVAFAQYYLTDREIAVNREIGDLDRRMRAAAVARYSQGGGDQTAVIQAQSEETAAKTEAARLQGDKDAARARLNALVGRKGDAPLDEPQRLRPLPAGEPVLATLVERATAANPTLAANDAAVAAARSRRTLADKAWYPDVTVGAGPLIQTNHRPVGLAATVGVNIPLSWGREASGQHEAAAQLGAAQQKYEAAVREVEGALGEALAKLRAARATEALIQKEALPQARATFQTVLADYSQGKGDLTAAIAAEHQVHDVDLRLLQTQLDEQTALAAIERLIGGNL